MNDEIIKKCKGIDKDKEDSSIIEKFEQIYSNFTIAKRSPKIPKIIKEEDLSDAINANDDFFLGVRNLIDKNSAYLLRKPFFDSKKHAFEKEDLKKEEENNEKYNKKNKLIKNIIDQSKELITKRIIQKEINQISKNGNKEKKEYKKGIFITDKNEESNNQKKFRIQNIVEKKNEQKKISYYIINKAKAYNVKSVKNKRKNKDKERKNMKDIYKKIYGIIDNNISINDEIKYQVKNPYERLYNQGFFSKNKSQINILDNINQIKKESNHKIFSKKSKELLYIIKTKNIIKTPRIKYDRNNLYTPIKSNIKFKNEELTFRPELNEKAIRNATKLEDPFLRIAKPKLQAKAMTPKKVYLKKGEYDRYIQRINGLYLDGEEKIKKKKKLSTLSPTSFSDESEFEINQAKKRVHSMKFKYNQNSRNTYYQQIQMKKKLIFENIKRKKIYNDNDNSEYTFKPQILKRNLKFLIKKQLSETDIKDKKKKSLDSILSQKKNDFSIPKKRLFVVNNEDANKSTNNNSRIYLYYQKDKSDECDKRDKYNKIEISMIQRKLYNLEKFFSKQSL